MADHTGKNEEISETIESHPIEEMGIMLPSGRFLLSERFIEEVLRPPSSWLFQIRQEELKGRPKVRCPFCKAGFLKLVSVKPTYDGGINPVPRVLHHVGDECEYTCSNEDCGGKFFGRRQWMFID